MYDHDLRTWYRDLFLHSARRRAAAEAKACAARTWDWTLPEADTLPAGGEIDVLRNHERPQARY
jgi:hypothetical protein